MRRPLLAFLVLSLTAIACPAADSSLAVTVKSSKGELLPDAVVSLVPLDGQPPATGAATPVIIAQEDKEFDPYVTPILIGTEVVFPNRDNIQHHLYSLSKPKRFEKPLYASGAKESIVFDLPGVVTLSCNIHDWMIAYVVVLGTPWFAKTGPEGSAEIAAIPAGRYRLEAWHPRLAKVATQEITVTAGARGTAEFSLALKPDRRLRRAPTGKTGGY